MCFLAERVWVLADSCSLLFLVLPTATESFSGTQYQTLSTFNPGYYTNKLEESCLQIKREFEDFSICI